MHSGGYHPLVQLRNERVQVKPFFWLKMEESAKKLLDLKSSFIGAIRNDFGIKLNNSKNYSVFFCEAIRAICGVHANQIRASNGLPKASTSDAEITKAIEKIISSRPIKEEVTVSALLEMQEKVSSVNVRLNTWQEKTAFGISRFMSLSRKSMKYGSERLAPESIVAELQADYVNRVQVSKFSSKAFYKSREWKELRLAVLSVCDRCMLCGASKESGAILHVDHIKPRSLWPELSLNIDNMQILCSECNLAKSNVISEKY